MNNQFYKEKKKNEIIRIEKISENGVTFYKKDSNNREWMSTARLELFYVPIDIYEEQIRDSFTSGVYVIIDKMKKVTPDEWGTILKNPGAVGKQTIIGMIKNTEKMQSIVDGLKIPETDPETVAVIIEETAMSCRYHISSNFETGKNDDNKTMCGKTIDTNDRAVMTSDEKELICKHCLTALKQAVKGRESCQN